MDRRLLLTAVVAATLLAAGPRAEARGAPRETGDFPDIGYATWTDAEPEYRFYPGDELDITVPSASELNRSVTVQPDGRIAMPLIGPVMAADRSIAVLEATLEQAYASQLRDPVVSVALKAAGPLKVFVGGEVDKPGVYDLPGDIDALRAIILAGGFKVSARQTQVVVIRRGPGGRAMMRTVDLKHALKTAAGADLVPLRRFDIVYVPRSNVAEAGLFIQQYIRDLVPGQVGFSYSVGSQAVGTAIP